MLIQLCLFFRDIIFVIFFESYRVDEIIVMVDVLVLKK